MTRRLSIGAIVREAVASGLSQRVFTVITLLVVAGSTLTILATTGHNAATEAAVLDTIDSQGTRTIVVQAQNDQPEFTTELVDSIRRIPQVESVVGLGPVQDATAAAVPDGARTGVRTGYGVVNGEELWQPAKSAVGPVALASTAATETVGLPSGRGSLRLIDGAEYIVAGELAVPEFLRTYEPLTLIPADPVARDEPQPLSSIVILTRTPESVALVDHLVRGLLTDIPSDGLTIQTSQQMADLRAAVNGELTEQGRAIILGLMAAAAAVTLLNVWGLVLLRRKDFGRRRALGASRLTIVTLIVTQVLVTAAVGAALGTAAGLARLSLGSGPLPEWRYTVAVGLGLILTAAFAAAVPATVAARRDPLRELRVP